MKKCKLAAMAWLSVCIVLFTSCGNSAGVSAGSTSEVKSTAVSESTAEEKQPYEILREKEDETKQIAADEEQQVKELQDALNAVNLQIQAALNQSASLPLSKMTCIEINHAVKNKNPILSKKTLFCFLA